MRVFKLGAPSQLGGGVAINTVMAAFVGVVFPVKVRFTNLVAHSLSFPEISGLFINAVTSPDNSKEVEIQSLDAMVRLTSSIEQIAWLNNHEEMVAVEVDFPMEGDADDQDPEEPKEPEEPKVPEVPEPTKPVSAEKPEKTKKG